MGIELKNVSKAFGRTEALSGVTVSFGGDRIYGLLGNNGAGKSTLMNLVVNRLYPTGGEVTIDGEAVSNNDSVLSQVFMMGEKNLFPEDIRVGRAFAVMADFYSAFDSGRALELSKKFGLPLKKKVQALSTGYKSIFKLVTALSARTKYLLLDEPVLGLDAQHRDMFYRELIEDFSKNPRTIMISTHLISEVESIIEHAVIIKDGRIVADAPVEELVAGACCVTGPAGRVDEYAAGREVISSRSIGGLKSVNIRGGAGELPEGLEAQRLSLQDYFISLMEGEGK